ncbi:hypothetical protein F5B17DRAFT_156993 [Nemania serpens]|nr:hypothetical protein F5B17DRAFT_156993 [Nemania serpens]
MCVYVLEPHFPPSFSQPYTRHNRAPFRCANTVALDHPAISRRLPLIIPARLPSSRLGLEPPVPQVEPAGAQALQLGVDLVLVKRHAVGLLGLGPEVGHREPLVQVGSEVEHDADREHDVHAELFRGGERLGKQVAR